MKKLLESFDDYALSVSVTTRKPRPGEVDGKDYFFRTKEEVEEMIAQDQLLEYARYVDNYYGTPRSYVEEKLSEGKKKLAMLFLMLPFWVNSLIRLYGWIIILQKKGLLNYLLLKLGIIQEPLKILYSYPAIVIGMIYVLLPFMALSVYSSAEKLDWSLVEAARDLGASRWKAFWSVTFKLTLPGLLSGVILTFIPSMGLFFIADILGGNKIVLVGSLIQEQMTRGNNWPFAAALAVVLMILTTLMIVLYRKLTNVKELEGIG